MNDSVYLQFDNMILNNKLFHSYLFEVDNYEDDYQIILNFVKMILFNCASKDVIDVDKEEFNQIDNNCFIDLKVIEPDGNEIKVDQMRSVLKDFSNTSLANKSRVYIIKECDKFNGYSANAMLKFLEEPCDNVYAILVTNNKYKVIDTIISRCQSISLKKSLDVVEVEQEFIDGILDAKKMLLNYDYFLSTYFVDKDISKTNLLNVQKYLMNKLKDFNNINKITNIILVIEENIKKLKYNVNFKLWLDCLIAELMEVEL